MTTASLPQQPPIAATHDARPRRIPIGKPFVYLLLLVYLVIVVYPMFWLIATSLKPNDEIFLHPFRLPDWHHLVWNNFSHAWTQAKFSYCVANSILITIVSVVVTIFLAATTAFAVSRYRFALAKPMFFFFIAGLMIPLQLTIVPLFFQMKQWHMLDTQVGLCLAYVGFGLPFSVFILGGFFKGLPRSLQEAARLDGCTEWQVFRHVMLPLARPGLITVAIFLIIGNWNEFFVAFICMSGKNTDKVRTLPLGLADITITSQYHSDWGMAFAGLVIVMLPTVIAYIFLQKHLTTGITAGAVKG